MKWDRSHGGFVGPDRELVHIAQFGGSFQARRRLFADESWRNVDCTSHFELERKFRIVLAC